MMRIRPALRLILLCALCPSAPSAFAQVSRDDLLYFARTQADAEAVSAYVAANGGIQPLTWDDRRDLESAGLSAGLIATAPLEEITTEVQGREFAGNAPPDNAGGWVETVFVDVPTRAESSIYHTHYTGCGHPGYEAHTHSEGCGHPGYERHRHSTGCGCPGYEVHRHFTGCGHPGYEAHVHVDGCGHPGYERHRHVAGCGHPGYEAHVCRRGCGHDVPSLPGLRTSDSPYPYQTPVAIHPSTCGCGPCFAARGPAPTPGPLAPFGSYNPVLPPPGYGTSAAVHTNYQPGLFNPYLR